MGMMHWKANTSTSWIKQYLDIKIQVIDDEERLAAPWIGEDALLVSVCVRFESVCSSLLLKSLRLERHDTANALLNQ